MSQTIAIGVPRATQEAPSSGNVGWQIVDRHVDAGHGECPAMRFLGRHDDPGKCRDVYTYARLANESNRFANVLECLGTSPGESVFVLAGRIPGLYVAVLGALKGRHLVCPLFPAFGPEPIMQRMTLGEAKVLVTTRALYKRKIAPIRHELTVRHVILLDADGLGDLPEGTLSFARLMAEASDEFYISATDPEDPALLHFTSGTTGMPKGAVHVHGALTMQRDTTTSVLGVRPDDVYWCTADPGWVTGTSYGIIGPLAAGATLVVDEAEFDAERWYRVLAGQRVAVWYTAPTAIRMLMRAGADMTHGVDLTNLRSAFSVGEPLSADAVRWGVDELGLPFRDTWWQTETGSIMIANTFESEVRPGSMGHAVDGIEIALLATDDEGELIVDAEGHVAEITDPHVAGMIAIRPGWPSMFRTYLNAAERYQKAFVDGWYIAGDLARRDTAGYYWFVGRADDVIKTAGHLIGPFEVESVLNDHPDVTASGVYGIPDDVAGNLIHACVVLRSGAEPCDALMSDVMAHARRRLGAALAPRQIVAVDRLPLTRSGKTMRRLLRARELGLPEGDLSTLEGVGES
jgi:acetyl-CoA synthetase